MAFSALYDADVLIPFEIRDVLMISASTRTHAVYWSDDILEEWLRNPVTKDLAPRETVQSLQRIMNEMFPGALVNRNRYERLIDSMSNHPKDRHVLAAAITADVDVIVTNNIDDFPKESIEHYQIEVQTADQFVLCQAAFNPISFMTQFRARAQERNRLALMRGREPLEATDIALFLRDGPSRMTESGDFILQLLTR